MRGSLAPRRASAAASARAGPRRPASLDLPLAVDPVTVSIVVSAPREQVFDYLQDIANHAEFTDHYLVDWHLTRMDSVGRGAGARFRVKAPGNRFSWGDVTFVEVEPPAPDRRGRAHRQEQPHPHARRLRARAAAAGSTRVRFTFQTAPATLSDRLMRGARRALVDAAQERSARCTGCAGSSSEGEGRGQASDCRRRIDCRVACPAALRKRSLARSCPRWPLLALSACGDSHTRVTTGTYAGESGANAPYLNVGPLIYEVQLSRELNPYNNEDAAYLEGLDASQRASSNPARSGSRSSCRSTTTTQRALPPRQRSRSATRRKTSTRPIVPSETNLFAYRAGLVPPKARSRRPARSPRRSGSQGELLLYKIADRLARQPAARAEDRRPRKNRRSRPSAELDV